MPTQPPRPHLRRLVPSILSLVMYLAQTVPAQFDSRLCYYIYNHVQPDARPCYPPSAKPISHCCGVGSTCLGDTLCLSSDGPMYIGSCTVKDWFNATEIPSDCPKYYEYCKGNIGEDITITVCNVKDDNTWEACCGAGQGAASCCTKDRFTIGNLTHEFAIQRPWNLKESNANLTTSLHPSEPTTAIASDASCNPSAGHSIGDQKAQIGVSAGLGVPLLLSLGLLLMERRKRRQAEAKVTQQDFLTPLSEPKLRGEPLCSYEVDASSPSAELSTQTPVQELPNGQHFG